MPKSVGAHRVGPAEGAHGDPHRMELVCIAVLSPARKFLHRVRSPRDFFAKHDAARGSE